MDKFRIDSHKLIYHVERVNDWLKGKDIYPIYVEIGPSGSCNHRCIYCGLDFMGYKPRFLEAKVIKNRVSEMARLGVKSIMYAGEGEPLLHQDIGDIVRHTKNTGIDVAITTNGALLNRDLANYILGDVAWIKVSIDAGTRETYAKIHRSAPVDFDKVIKNITYVAELKRRKNYKCALGVQLLLLPENSHEVIGLAKKSKSLGIDYFVVKPYSQHPLSKTKKYKSIKYAKYLYLMEELNNLNTGKFNTVFRINMMKKWDEGKRNYRHCYALPFWSYIDASGTVWGCSNYLGHRDKTFLYGNIYRNTFKEIWQGSKREKSLRIAETELDTRLCRINCRMDEINRYLWELKHHSEHINFI